MVPIESAMGSLHLLLGWLGPFGKKQKEMTAHRKQLRLMNYGNRARDIALLLHLHSCSKGCVGSETTPNTYRFCWAMLKCAP